MVDQKEPISAVLPAMIFSGRRFSPQWWMVATNRTGILFMGMERYLQWLLLFLVILTWASWPNCRIKRGNQWRVKSLITAANRSTFWRAVQVPVCRLLPALPQSRRAQPLCKLQQPCASIKSQFIFITVFSPLWGFHGYLVRWPSQCPSPALQWLSQWLVSLATQGGHDLTAFQKHIKCVCVCVCGRGGGC